MYLGNPLLPINLTVASAIDSVKKELSKRFWHEHELKPLKLNLVPYFLFNYHYYFEQDDSAKKTIKKSTHGILAVDGHDVSIREDQVELIKHNWKKGSNIIPKGAFEEKWNNIEKREQDAVLTLKTAEQFNVSKDNVVISSARKVFIPFYKTSVIAGGKEYPLIINAVDGTIEGIKKIPHREKGRREIAKETINELKDPKNWIKYSKDAILESTTLAASSAKDIKIPSLKEKKNSKLNIFDSKIILIVIMIIALLLIIFSLLRIRLP
ncbi:MAG: hypothetical protein WCI04_01200 [archaeon]